MARRYRLAVIALLSVAGLAIIVLIRTFPNSSAGQSADVPSDPEQSIAVLRRAVEFGVNHIDTAAFYFSAPRSANELINTAGAIPGQAGHRDQGGSRA